MPDEPRRRRRSARADQSRTDAQSAHVGAGPSLDEAIQQLVNLGERDPIEIVRKLEHRLGNDWLRDQVAADAETFAASLARYYLGAQRRTAEIALRPGDGMATAEFKVAKIWVPGSGHKRAADCTPADLRAKAEWYEVFAVASLRRAEWCRDVASLLEEQGATTLGDFTGTLPPLPEASLEELTS